MFAKRKSYNPKRALETTPSTAELKRLLKDVRYGGNADHKRNPGDFNLAPPLGPRPGKTLCDEANILKRSVASKLLKAGIRRGCVSKLKRNGFPQNIWAVSADGIPMEAQLENRETGAYHGYPMSADDPFREKVIQQWNVNRE